MANRSVLLYLTHIWNDDVRSEYEKLCRETSPGFPETWLLLDKATPGAQDLAALYPRCYLFDLDVISSDLSYPMLHRNGLLGHVQFPVQHFFLTHRDYDYYWFVEYDVRYTGDWEAFFKSFNAFDHDMVTTHIRRFEQEPCWFFWNSLSHPVKAVERGDLVRSFNVIYRISKRALEYMHQVQIEGWQGHPEVLYPTLLLKGGFSLLDFGGSGDFVPPGYGNRFYTSYSLKTGGLVTFGTVRFRPSRKKAGKRKNTIYHPVKPSPFVEPVWKKISMTFAEWKKDFICRIK